MVVKLSSMQTFASKFCAFVEGILDGLFIFSGFQHNGSCFTRRTKLSLAKGKKLFVSDNFIPFYSARSCPLSELEHK